MPETGKTGENCVVLTLTMTQQHNLGDGMEIIWFRPGFHDGVAPSAAARPSPGAMLWWNAGTRDLSMAVQY